jgi:colicin import membrane protein
MKNRSTLIAFISALLLHIIAGTLLLLNVDFSNIKPKPKNEVPIINATVVDQKLFDDLAQRKSDKEQAEKKKVEQEKKKVEEEKQRIQQEKKKAEALRKKRENTRIQAEKAETLRKKKEAERVVAEKALVAKQLKAKQDAEKAKKIANDKRQAENARKQAEEKRKKIEAQKAEAQRVEAEKVKAQKIAAEKAAAAAKVKAEQEKERLRRAELDKQMDAQFEDTFSNAQSSRQLSEIARYTALIQDKISRNWQVEPSMKGKSCTLRIRLAADGLVISAKRSSGDIKLCESAKRAALKANTLPIPKDPDISTKFRDFDITLKPEF